MENVSSTPSTPPATAAPAPTGAAPAPTPTPAPAAPAGDGSVATSDEMRDALKEVFDPEIPINIVDLGLIYKLEPKEGGAVDIEMTLTSPHCPVGDQLKARVTEVVTKCKGVKSVNVNLVYQPMWTKEKMTFEGKLQASMLGIM